MRIKSLFRNASGNQSGAVAMVVAFFAMFIFLGLSAIALDIAHLYVVRNELQNAADAGALFGAQDLYYSKETAPSPDLIGSVNITRNDKAYEVARAHSSDKILVDVRWTGDNLKDEVRRGHWKFVAGSSGEFKASNNTIGPNLARSTEELNDDWNFVNAVEVITRRGNAPGESGASSFFGRIFGYEQYFMAARAVAYIGFAGTIMPGGVDIPVALCSSAVIGAEGHYTCEYGRMVNSDSKDDAASNTGGWTDYVPCGQKPPTSSSSLKDILATCSKNTIAIAFGTSISTSGGANDVVWEDLKKCWTQNTDTSTPKDGVADVAWTVTLPVVECTGNNVTSCENAAGAVDLDVLWLSDSSFAGNPDPLKDPEKYYASVPDHLSVRVVDSAGVESWDNWSNNSSDGYARWQSFRDHFNLKKYDSLSETWVGAEWLPRTMYVKPSCTPHEPQGTTGGKNYGVLAKNPVLVH